MNDVTNSGRPQVAFAPVFERERWIDLLGTQLANSTETDLAEIETVSLDDADPERVEHVVGWYIDAEPLRALPRLRSVHVTGAGYDHIDLDRMPDVPVARLVDPVMAYDIASYCTAWTIYFTREFDTYARAQRQSLWDREQTPVYATDVTVGVVGTGAIGEVVVDQLNAQGFHAIGWSRTVNDRSLPQLFADADVIILLVPLTEATRGLVSDELLGQLGNGTLINIARGAVVDDDALRRALDGPMRAAVLDVFTTEPLPPDAWQWRHPKVVVTPHIAGRTDPRSASALIAADIVAVREGKPPSDPVPR